MTTLIPELGSCWLHNDITISSSIALLNKGHNNLILMFSSMEVDILIF